MNHYTVEYRNEGSYDRVHFVSYRDALAHAEDIASSATCPVRIWKNKVVYEIPSSKEHTWRDDENIILGEN